MNNILLLCIIFLSLVFARRDCLQQAELDPLGRSSRPEKDTFAISPSGHFFVHYDITGSAAPDLTDSDGNGVPDYVDEVGIIADSAHHVLVDMMEWEEEPFDGEGGYDIFIESYAPGVYGYNTPDVPSLNSDGQTSYLQIDNDYLGFNSIFNLSSTKIMQISVAHEYFHGLQWGYRKNTSGSKYLYEMTSMWFEDILIPDGNDYLDGWPDDLLNNPTADFDKTGGGYELALFGHYLSSFVDENGQTDEKNSSIMLEIWENFKSNSTSPSAFFTIQSLLETQYNMSFTEAWIDFMTRNLYNGIYEDMDNDFYYYIDQALIDPISTYEASIDDSLSISVNIDNESVEILTYEISDFIAILDIKHVGDEFMGNFILLADDQERNGFDEVKDTLTHQLYQNDVVHLIYGAESSSLDLTIDIIQYTAPIPPSNLTATAAQDSIMLNWNPSLGPGDNLKYIIYRNDDSLDVSPAPDTTYMDSNAIIGLTKYTYKVTCINEIGESLPSNSVTISSWPSKDNVTQNQILSIYPNPVHKTHDAHILYALGTNDSNTILELINIRGEIVKTVALQSYQQGWHRESINNLVLPEAASGIYIIHLRPNNGLGRTQKITILP